MLQLLPDHYQAWVGLLTLTALQIVLAVDNLIFLSIVSGTLPRRQQPAARRIGLALAAVGRLALLFALTWLIGLTEPILSLSGLDISSRDAVLIGGGLFLLGEGTAQIHHTLEGHEEGGTSAVTFLSAVTQIILLDAVFALDSIIIVVGMVDQPSVMVAAIAIAMVVMLVATNPVSAFVNSHPAVRMLALSFLLLVGMALVADGLHFHIPRDYLYAAIALSATIEALNLAVARAREKQRSADDAPD
jgi:predicted tellurium resistance membrane protein TerC